MKLRVCLGMAALALAAPAAAGAGAVAETETVRTPVDDFVVNPCTGEVVHVTGTVLTVIHLTQDASGGGHRIVQSINQGIQGVSDTGTRYVAPGGFNEATSDNGPNAQSNLTAISRSHLVSQTSTDNFFVLFVTHGTVNANGEVTVVVEKLIAECQG
jgi:hypothetical protein